MSRGDEERTAGARGRTDGGSDVDTSALSLRSNEVGEGAVESRYVFGEETPLSPVDPGTTLLVVRRDGASQGLVRSLLAAGNPDEALVAVTTNAPARRVLRDLDRRTGGRLVEPHVGVVDCTGLTTAQTQIRGFPQAHLAGVSGPGDLTGIGLRFSDLYGQVTERVDGDGRPPVRASLESLSTFLQFTDANTLFRFVHAYNGRLRHADAFGVGVVDGAAHDAQTLSLFGSLFDGMVEVRETDAGEQLRVRGLPDQPRDWQPL